MRSQRASRNPAQGIGAQVEQEIVKEVIIVGEGPEETTRKTLVQAAKVVHRDATIIEGQTETEVVGVKDLAQPSSIPTSLCLS
jgi:hypothetical protein